MKITTLCGVGDWVRGMTEDKEHIYYSTGVKLFQLAKHANAQPRMLLHTQHASCYCGIVCDGNNMLYICDFDKHVIMSYNLKSKDVDYVAGIGRKGFLDGNRPRSQFTSPEGIAIDRNGDLLIAEQHRVRKINLSKNTVETIAGSTIGYSDGPADTARFNNLSAIDIDQHGTIYVADWGNDRIRKIKDGIVSTVSTRTEFNNPFLLRVIHGKLFVGNANLLWVIDLETQTEISYKLKGCSQFTGLYGTLYTGDVVGIFKVETGWEEKRWLWIGNLKENPNDCMLACLPKDIIREIAKRL